MGRCDAIVFVVDDDASVRKSLQRLLSAAGHTVLCYGNAEDFLRDPARSNAGCAIIDLKLPGMNGLEIQRVLGADNQGPAVVFLTGRGDIPSSVNAMKAGAVDFLTKPVDSRSLLNAVDKAIQRNQHVRTAGAERIRTQALLSRLTPRERQVLEQVAVGKLNKQIAADLGAAEKTIKIHRGRLMKKLGAHSVFDLYRLLARD